MSKEFQTAFNKKKIIIKMGRKSRKSKALGSPTGQKRQQTLL